MRLCWLVSLTLETISGTNIFSAIAEDEVENKFFPGILIILLVLRGELKPTHLKATFHQFVTVATRGIGTRNRPISPLQLGVTKPE